MSPIQSRLIEKLGVLKILPKAVIDRAIMQFQDSQDDKVIYDGIWSLLNQALEAASKKFGYSEKAITIQRNIYLIMFQ